MKKNEKKHPTIFLDFSRISNNFAEFVQNFSNFSGIFWKKNCDDFSPALLMMSVAAPFFGGLLDAIVADLDGDPFSHDF